MTKLDRLWDELRREWERVGFDPQYLQRTQYWAEIRNVHPVHQLLEAAHRAFLQGIDAP